MSVNYKRSVIRSVVASGDDAYQTGTTVNTSASGLYLSATGDIIGLRFTNIAVPVGATVTRAYVRGYFQTGTANLRIYCEATDDAAGFTTGSNNIGERGKTEAYSTWSAAITAGGQNAPDFTSAVQEVIGRGGWASGNDLVVLLVNQAAAGLTLLSYDGGGSVLPELRIDYTMPAPDGEPVIDSVVSSSLRGATTHSFSVALPAGSGTRVYIAVHAMRVVFGTYEEQQFDLTSASLGGTSLTPILNEDYYASATVARHLIFEAIDPLGGGGAAGQTFVITFNKAVTMGISATVVTGVTERGTLTKYNSTDGGTGSFSATALSTSSTTSQIPGLVLATGSVRRKGYEYTDLYATDAAWMVGGGQTGTTVNEDLLFLVAAAKVDATGTWTLGVAWKEANDVGSIAAIPLYGRVAAAEIELSLIGPEVIYSSATLDGLMGEAEFSGLDPEIITGSIPPVQVSGRGQLFISTSARNLTVMMLVTDGDNWALVDGGGAVLQLGLRIVRRAGYLTPV